MACSLDEAVAFRAGMLIGALGLRAYELPMPQKQHLPKVSDKEQRMYEHIKESERESGRSLKRSKAIAAATVNKHHNEEGHSSNK
jgi:hypothetical protein